MAESLYEEILTGSYLNSRHKKCSRSDMITRLVNDEDLNCYPTSLRGSYISRLKSPCALECSSESFVEQSSESCEADSQEVTTEDHSFSPVLFDENLIPDSKSKSEACKSSGLQIPCKNIKEYRDTSKPNSPVIDIFTPPPIEHDLDSVDETRREVEDAIERYTQARIYASFESFLQDKKPCYVEKCGFRRNAMSASPDLMSAQRESRTVGDDLMKPDVDRSRSRSHGWGGEAAEDACDELYDKVNDRGSRSQLNGGLMTSSSEPDDCDVSTPFLRSYTVQIGTRANVNRCSEPACLPVVNCSLSAASAYTGSPYTASTGSTYTGSPYTASAHRRLSCTYEDEDDDCDEDYEEEYDDEDEDEAGDDESVPEVGGVYPDIAEC